MPRSWRGSPGDNPAVRLRRLGRTGFQVSELCLGAMTFGGTADLDESRRIVDTYLDAGGNFVDTANNYAGGASEEHLGEILAGRRDRVVLATKYTAPIRSGDPNSGGNHRKSLVLSLEQSLRRLRTDYVDLLWVHVWDFGTPVKEVMRALDDQVRAGKVLSVGVSDVPAWTVAQANTLAELRGWSPFAALQIEYSLVERTVERELVPLAGAFGLPVLAWGPLAGGLLTGKYADGSSEGRLEEGDRRMTEHNHAIVAAVVGVAEEAGATPAQVALAWLRARQGAKVIPIMGARSADQLRGSLGCLDVELSGEHLARLDEASAIQMGFPHDFLAMLAARYGRRAGSSSGSTS
jgi:aryl-alcohol dehydrogenase-like predicted oxidoreductase